MTGGAGPAVDLGSQCVVCAFAPAPAIAPSTPRGQGYTDLLNALSRKGFRPTLASSTYAAMSALCAHGNDSPVRVLILADPTPHAKELVEAVHAYAPSTRVWIYASHSPAGPGELRALLPHDTARWSSPTPPTHSPTLSPTLSPSTSPATSPAVSVESPGSGAGATIGGRASGVIGGGQGRALRLVSEPGTVGWAGEALKRGAEGGSGGSGSFDTEHHPTEALSDAAPGSQGLGHLLTDEELAMLLDSGDETGQG